MDDTNRDLVSLISVILLLIIRQSSINITVQQFFARRHRRRRFRLRYLQALSALHLNLRARRQFARRPRRAWVFPRPQNWFQELLNNNALDHWWKENFRVSRDTFEYICQLVGPALQRQNTRMRDAIPVPKCVGASLWRLATGECYRSCGLMVGLAKPTVVKCCHEFVQEICRLQDEFIKFPSTAAEIAKKMKGFDNKSKLPNVVGAIDGSHVPIKAPKINHEDYFKRKHFYSFLVQGIVDASGLYLSVATGFPGSLHDARMLRLTDVYWAAEDENILMEPTFDLGGTVVRPLIVGDTAYPNKTWLIRPFKDNGGLTRDQRNFNREVSKARIVSEHAFGMTKGRWRVLLKRLDEDSDRIPDTIIACCVLHNICVLRGDELDIDDSDDDDSDDDDDDDGGPPSQAAAAVLQALVQYVANQ